MVVAIPSSMSIIQRVSVIIMLIVSLAIPSIAFCEGYSTIELSREQEFKLYLYDKVDYNHDMYIIFANIINCESSWNEKAKNKKTNAAGFFQIIDTWWKETATKKGLDYRNNWRDNIDMGMIIYKTQGLSAWDESKSCWRK
jgi:muramidase (phage lysozyme)